MKKEDLHNVNWDLISDILTDKASENQKAEFENWLNQNDSNSSFFNKIKEIWLKTGNLSHFYSADTNYAWEIVKSKTVQKHTKVVKLKRTLSWAISAAASLLLIFYFSKNIRSPKEATLSTTNNSIIAYKLPDNSEVDLNYQTEIKYNKKFIRKNRELRLNGEAFFDIEKMKSKPFIIHTEQGSFKVLGTSFNISSYKNDSLLSLFVKTGEVEFFSENIKGSVIVKKGEQIHYNKINKKLSKKKNKTENFIAWKTKELTFDDLTLEEIAAILKRVYNTEIRFENENIQQIRFTAQFKGQSLDKILKVIAITFELEIQKTDDYIKLLEVKNEQTKGQNN